MKIEMTVWDAVFMRMVCYAAPARHEENKQARKLRRRIEREGAPAFETAEAELRDGGLFAIQGESQTPVSLDLSVEELALVDALARRIVWDPRANARALIDHAYDFVEELLATWIEEAQAEEIYQKLPAKQRQALRQRAKKDKDES